MTILLVQRAALSRAVNRVAATSTKTAVESIQALARLAIGQDGVLALEVTTIDASLRCTVVPESVNTNGVSVVVVAPDLLKKQIDSLDDELVTLRMTEGALFIESGGEYEIIAHAEPEMFPQFPEVTGTQVTLDGVHLRWALERILPCLSVNPSQNYALTGALLTPRLGFVEFVGTDLRCLLRARIPVPECQAGPPIVIPRSAVQLLLSLKPPAVQLTLGDRFLGVRTEGVTSAIALIGSEYPSLDEVFSQLSAGSTTKLPAAQFVAALQRIVPLTDAADGVRFSLVSPQQLLMQSAKAGRGRAKVTVPCESNCPGAEIVLSPAMVLQFLQHAERLDTDRMVSWHVCKSLANGAMPSHFILDGDVLDFTYLVMPMIQ